MNKNKEKIKKKTIILAVIGIIFMLLLIISSTFAFFMVNIGNNTSKTVITGKTEEPATVSLLQNTESLRLVLDREKMNLSNVGNYYADDEEDYVSNKSLGYHELSTLTLTNSNEDNNIYKCSMNVNVTFDTSQNSLGSVIEENDIFVHFMIGNQNYEYDLSKYKSTGTLSQDIEIELIGNSDKILYGYVELQNKETSQMYMIGKKLNLSINTTLNKCELTGKEGVFTSLDNYLVNEQYGKMYRSAEYKDKIKNISFVNYIDKDVENKTNWDLTQTSGKRKSPAESVIAWLEENGDETYNMFIGTKKSNQVIFTIGMNFAFYNMKELTDFDFSNLNTSMATNMLSTFRELPKLITLDLTMFDTSNVTTMNTMFYVTTNIQSIKLENFNTSKVTDMYLMFYSCDNLQELDLSNFNTSNVTTMRSFLAWTNKLENADLTSFDFSKVKDIGHFANNSGLRNVNLRSLQENDLLTDSSGMFSNMKNLETLDIRNMDFTKFTTYENMFTGITSNPTIIVKDEANKKWIEDRLNEAGVSANVIIPY